MADKAIENLAELTEIPQAEDLALIVDISETQDLQGDGFISKAKKITVDNLLSYQTSLSDNLLINPSFSLFQRQDPTVQSGRSDDQYAADRFYVLTQTASVNNIRISGDQSRYAWRITQNQTAAQRFGCAQIVEGINCHHLKDRGVTFGGRIRINSGQAIYAAILEWTGTEDIVTSDFVNNWNSQTNTTGNFFIATNYRIPDSAVKTLTPPSGMWSGFSVTGMLSSGLHNVIVGLWTKESGVNGFTVDCENFQLHPGTILKKFKPRHFETEVAFCQRYYEKSYSFNQPPGYAHAGGEGAVGMSCSAAGTTFVRLSVSYQNRKRAVATITTYDGLGNANKTTYLGPSANNQTINIQENGEEAFMWETDDTTSKNGAYLAWTADIEL